MQVNTTYNDKDIVRLIQSDYKSDRDKALRYIYKIHYMLAERHILKNSGTVEEAADIFQDAIIILYNQIRAKKFRNDASIKTYLYVIVKNRWIRELKKNPHQFSGIESIDNYVAPNGLEHAKTPEHSELLHQLLEELNDECRKVLVDYYYKNQSMQEIKEGFGLSSEQAAKNKKYRCLQYLIKLCKKRGISKEMIY